MSASGFGGSPRPFIPAGISDSARAKRLPSDLQVTDVLEAADDMLVVKGVTAAIAVAFPRLQGGRPRPGPEGPRSAEAGQPAARRFAGPGR